MAALCHGSRHRPGAPIRLSGEGSFTGHHWRAPPGSGSQSRPDETGSAYDQANGRRDEGPRGSANSLGHPLIESGALLYYPDVEGLLCTPSDVLAADVTQEFANSSRSSAVGSGIWWSICGRRMLKNRIKAEKRISRDNRLLPIKQR
jgi:hypothetical protein